jgi:hypothetical protein
VMDMRKKKKIIILGLCIGFVVFLAVYLGLFAGRETPPFEISKVYSLPLGENEEASVRRVIVSDLTGDGQKEVLISYDVASYEEGEVEGEITAMLSFKEARMVILSSAEVGDLQKLWEYDAGLIRQTAAIGDFDGDSKLDVVVGGMIENIGDSPQSVTSRIEVLLQREDSSFGKVFSSNIPQFIGLGFIETGDLDGDGKTDFVISGLAVESESPYHACLLHNEGVGNFTMSPIALKEGIVVEGMWKSDTNNDGWSDLVISALDWNNETYSMISLLNNGRGEFELRELDVSLDMLVIEDFTGNVYPDIIYTKADQSGDKVYFLRNEQGEFAEPSSIDVLSGKIIAGMVSADFNNDNTPDVLFFEPHVEFREDLERFEISLIGHLLLIEEDVEREFSSTWEWSQKFLEGKSISSKYATVAADINDDEWIDLVLVSRKGEVYLALNQQT